MGLRKNKDLLDVEKDIHKHVAYMTENGMALNGFAEELLNGPLVEFVGKVQLIFTSPPFPLNRKKRYGNKTGTEYLSWLSNFAKIFREYLTENGSIAIEIGNAWEPGIPAMSSLPIESLLKFKKEGGFYLLEEFIVFNPARLPSPAQWVNIERIRVKDAFTRIWWLSPNPHAKADNRKILIEYSSHMKKLLKNKRYNHGKRPSEHNIGKESFLKDNGGSIPPNVLINDEVYNFLVASNTVSSDNYRKYCKENNIKIHPARMPIDIPTFFIKFLTDMGDLVMDPFAGSNTTGYVAENLNRKWISIDPDIEYIKGSIGRFSPDNINYVRGDLNQ